MNLFCNLTLIKEVHLEKSFKKVMKKLFINFPRATWLLDILRKTDLFQYLCCRKRHRDDKLLSVNRSIYAELLLPIILHNNQIFKNPSKPFVFKLIFSNRLEAYVFNLQKVCLFADFLKQIFKNYQHIFFLRTIL